MENHHRYDKIFPATIIFSVCLMLLGIIMDAPQNILPGLYRIVTMQDLLITDYIQIAGVGAAMVNAGIVTIISVCIIKLSGDPFNGFTIVEMAAKILHIVIFHDALQRGSLIFFVAQIISIVIFVVLEFATPVKRLVGNEFYVVS